MIKRLLCSSVLLSLMACSPSVPSSTTIDFPMPEALKNCKLIQLSVPEGTQGGSTKVNVVKCGNPSTTTTVQESCGKNCTRDVSTTIVEE